MWFADFAFCKQRVRQGTSVCNEYRQQMPTTSALRWPNEICRINRCTNRRTIWALLEDWLETNCFQRPASFKVEHTKSMNPSDCFQSNRPNCPVTFSLWSAIIWRLIESNIAKPPTVQGAYQQVASLRTPINLFKFLVCERFAPFGKTLIGHKVKGYHRAASQSVCNPFEISNFRILLLLPCLMKNWSEIFMNSFKNLFDRAVKQVLFTNFDSLNGGQIMIGTWSCEHCGQTDVHIV